MCEDTICYTDKDKNRPQFLPKPLVQPLQGKNPKNKVPKVTIIVPMYNVEKYIEACVLSLVNQSYQNIEIYLIDDCSVDNTLKIAELLSEKYPNKIKVIKNEENCGTYISINKGIFHSTGEYITIIGADDQFRIDKVEQQVNVLKNKNIVACYCYYERHGHKSNKILSIRLGESTIMFKRSIIRDIGYYDSVRFSGDSEYMERINSYYGKHRVIIIRKIMYLAISRPESLTTSSGKSNINSEIRKIYKRNYSNWHNSKNNLFIDFPLKQRPFKIPNDMVTL